MGLHIPRAASFRSYQTVPFVSSTRRFRPAAFVAMLDAEIRATDGKSVIVLTAAGVPVSIGKIHILETPGMGPQIEIQFSTEIMTCSLRVPPGRLAALRASGDDGRYRYRLPEGDRLWLDKPEPASAASAPDTGLKGAQATQPAPVIETFPIPPQSRPTGVDSKPQGKPDEAKKAVSPTQLPRSSPPQKPIVVKPVPPLKSR